MGAVTERPSVFRSPGGASTREPAGAMLRLMGMRAGFRLVLGALVGLAVFCGAVWGLNEVRYPDERTPVRALSATIAADDRTLVLRLDACVGPLDVAQALDGQSVKVTVELIGPMPEITPPCEGGVQVMLDEPLRGRAVVDGSSGGQLRVVEARG